MEISLTGCRLAWFITGSVGVKRRETRCEGGECFGATNGATTHPLPSPPVLAASTLFLYDDFGATSPLPASIVLTRRPGLGFVGEHDGFP
jgi:hypothetical protein